MYFSVCVGVQMHTEYAEREDEFVEGLLVVQAYRMHLALNWEIKWKKSVFFNFKECDSVILYKLVISRILFYFIVDQ